VTFISLCPILLPASVWAGGLSEQQVKAAVQTWVRYVTADARPDAVIDRMEPYRENGQTVAYIAYLDSGGFCLCGRDYLVAPVYLYSPEGVFDPENPGYQYILSEIASRTQVFAEEARLKSSVPKL